MSRILLVVLIVTGVVSCASTTHQRQLVVTHIGEDCGAEPFDGSAGYTTYVVDREARGESQSQNVTVNRTLSRIDLNAPRRPAAVEPSTASERRSDELFRLPVDEPSVTSPFGMRDDPIRRGRRRMHRGVDLTGSPGTPVYATASGIALMAGYCDRGTGNCVVIEHANGWRSQYFHLNAVRIRVNQHVEQGQCIGDIGSTGRSTGPHLHFQIGRNGEAMDPMSLIGTPLEQ